MKRDFAANGSNARFSWPARFYIFLWLLFSAVWFGTREARTMIPPGVYGAQHFAHR